MRIAKGFGTSYAFLRLCNSYLDVTDRNQSLNMCMILHPVSDFDVPGPWHEEACAAASRSLLKDLLKASCFL